MSRTRNKVLVYHRGSWQWIDNSHDAEELSDAINGRRSEHMYRRRWWKLGPAYLYPDYVGILISTYAYVGTRNLPGFLIFVRSVGISIHFYAWDLPDLIEVLSLLSPIVLTGLLSDVYQRNYREG